MADAISSLEQVFSLFRRPVAIYCDRGQHFDNSKMRSFLKDLGISITYSPSGASKSTGMIEISNRLLEDVLRKQNQNWDEVLSKSSYAVNTRPIEYLDMSSNDIIFELSRKIILTTTTLLSLSERNIRS